MKNLALAINRHMHPLSQGMAHRAMTSTSLKIETIDSTIFPLYVPIQEAITDRHEQNHNRAR